ncbi:MAG TPA: 4Fe-4S dicluster domain-containing protein [Desulfotignum sp.]|jgi:anaerobic sulfite reductase subunit C|nr:4Fe-4S dicluster domain-containing protein [Desulfotignum sp.]
MKWSPEAEAAVEKVPFFIRKKVKKKVAAHVENQGRSVVTLSDVTALKQQFLAKGGMAKEVKGYEISACFGSDGCPHVACSTAGLETDLEGLLKQADLLSFLKSSLGENIKFHHEFRIALCDCPNACSRPQIADIGIMGAVVPKVGDAPCTGCRACVDVCPDRAIRLTSQPGNREAPVMDMKRCQRCGKCIQSCPSRTLAPSESGFRVLLGGRLGRHPRLAMEVPGLHSREQVLNLVQTCLNYYKIHSKKGKRFSRLFSRVDQLL